MIKRKRRRINNRNESDILRGDKNGIYRMEIHLDNEGVYNCLDDSDKERFEEAIISNVERVRTETRL